jgi:hypothetical protein
MLPLRRACTIISEHFQLRVLDEPLIRSNQRQVEDSCCCNEKPAARISVQQPRERKLRRHIPSERRFRQRELLIDDLHHSPRSPFRTTRFRSASKLNSQMLMGERNSALSGCAITLATSEVNFHGSRTLQIQMCVSSRSFIPAPRPNRIRRQ